MALFDDTFAPYHAFGSRNLKRGLHGTDVAVLQAVYNLMLCTMDHRIGDPVHISGYFDDATEHAVKLIQRYFGLVQDGIVGPKTFFVYGQGSQGNPTYGGPVYGSRQLMVGSSGGDVIVLQNRLNLYRYARIIGKPADGWFCDNTARAVRAFKDDAEKNGDTGFPANAIAGFGFFDASWLYTGAGGRGLFPGRNGFDVVFIQVLLKRYDHYHGPINGFYDSATQESVRQFQAKSGIKVDGIVGPVTFYHLGLNNDEAAPKPLGIAWPVKKQKVTVHCHALASALPDNLHPYGSAAYVKNDPEGTESLDVVGNLLPAPDCFGAQYSHYAFIWKDKDDHHHSVARLMYPLVTTGDWAGSYSPGVKSIPDGIIEVRPVPKNCPEGPYGPVVLSTCEDHHRVSIACVPLHSTREEDCHLPYGAASHVVNRQEGFESLDVVGNMLPDPKSYGDHYRAYAFTLTDPSSDQIVARELMVKIEDSDWAGSHSPGVKTIPEGIVTVYPVPAGQPSGPYGPAVLTSHKEKWS